MSDTSDVAGTAGRRGRRMLILRTVPLIAAALPIAIGPTLTLGSRSAAPLPHVSAAGAVAPTTPTTAAPRCTPGMVTVPVTRRDRRNRSRDQRASERELIVTIPKEDA